MMPNNYGKIVKELVSDVWLLSCECQLAQAVVDYLELLADTIPSGAPEKARIFWALERMDVDPADYAKLKRRLEVDG